MRARRSGSAAWRCSRKVGTAAGATGLWGDKKYVLPSLLPEFAGKVNLIYIDPPFDTGADFSFTTTVPETETSFSKEPSILEQKACRDTWGRGLSSYLAWFHETCVLLHELLADTGSVYVHLDYRLCHYAKAVLDEVFGLDAFLNQIVWRRTGFNLESVVPVIPVHRPVNQWQSYRTRKEPKITLETAHEYSEKGKYVVVVKVIDILGNDTTKTLQVEAK